jgi:hypothetical protein
LLKDCSRSVNDNQEERTWRRDVHHKRDQVAYIDIVHHPSTACPETKKQASEDRYKCINE